MSSSYHEEIERVDYKLTLEEEIELAKKIKKGDKKAEDKLICSNLKFVISLCRRYLGHGVLFEDLVGAGNLGLIEAAKRYDPQKHNNEKFITFAVWYIKHHIFESIMMYKFIYRIPNTYHNDILKLSKIKAKLERSLNRPPNKEELLDALEIDEKHYDTLENLLDQNKFVGLSDFVNKDKNVTYADIICNEQAGADKAYDLRERRLEIFKSLDVLTPREKEVVIAYYGLKGVRYSLKELGDGLGLTREAVRIIRNNALKKLKSKSLALRDFV